MPPSRCAGPRAGARPPAGLRGVPVRITGHAAVNTGLKAGHLYAYALFTHVRGRWAGPVTLLAGTAAAAGSKTASFAATPGTVLATPADVHGTRTTASGVQTTLSPGVTTPVLGSAVVLPQSVSLPGGYLGRVSGISANGSTVTLQPASLSDAFSYYDINIPNFTSAVATRLRPVRMAPSGTQSRRVAAERRQEP